MKIVREIYYKPEPDTINLNLNTEHPVVISFLTHPKLLKITCESEDGTIVYRRAE